MLCCCFCLSVPDPHFFIKVSNLINTCYFITASILHRIHSNEPGYQRPPQRSPSLSTQPTRKSKTGRDGGKRSWVIYTCHRMFYPCITRAVCRQVVIFLSAKSTCSGDVVQILYYIFIISYICISCSAFRRC